MKTQPKFRLYLFHASNAPRTVILRRGPSRLFRMILWDRTADSFSDGQWLKHKIYIDRCDISPDGEHFLFFALNGAWDSPSKGCYTAICRPPYFTALKLYPQGDTYQGGGYFIDNSRFYINTSNCTKDIIGSGARLQRIFRTETFWTDRPRYFDADGKTFDAGWPKFAWMACGRPSEFDNEFETEGASLYRIVNGDRKLVRDFSQMNFKRITAPDFLENPVSEAGQK